MRKILFILFVFLFAVPVMAADEELRAFRQLKNVNDLDLIVPSVVELPLEIGLIEWPDFAILEAETNEYQPYYYLRSEKEIINYSINSKGMDVSRDLRDNKSSTYVEYDLPEQGQGQVSIKIKSSSMLSSDALMIRLDRYVALPTSIEIFALVAGQQKTVLAKNRMKSSNINFPLTESKDWTINMSFSQPLRISELSLRQKNYQTHKDEAIRFLARPDKTYAVYINPDRSTSISGGESGNLRDDKGVIKLKSYVSKENPIFVLSDFDKDGVVDKIDNCVQVSNEDQTDIDGNLRGDACDDFDKDGIINSKDNCPDKPNRNQQDTDADKIGDVCDTEESRLTEKNPWLVWLGIGFVVLVISGLFIKTLKDK